MRLWNDYEGTTIAEAYPIEKLLRPEGRSAFFSTSNGTGTPAVIRLIESINDESEILGRWRTVADLNETHLITLKKFGQTTFEGTPLIYVLMESTEADLSLVLQERTLNVEETRQIATSLVGALQALHAKGIVHEHVEPSNVMATGEMVKLRSDCIREAPEGEEGVALKRQDVHDLAVVLLRALTNRKTLDGLDGRTLPAPFDQIIRNGISGGWGLTEIAGALNPQVVKPASTPAPRVPAATVAAANAAAGMTPVKQIPLVIPRATEQTAWSGNRPEPAKETSAAEKPAVSAPVTTTTSTPMTRPLAQRERITVPVEDEEPNRRPLWMAVAAAVLVIAAILGWRSFHKPAPAGEASQPVTTLSDGARPGAEGASSEATSRTEAAAASAAQPIAKPSAQTATDAPSVRDGARPWKVVAFTYNRRDQAQHKADSIAQRNPSLRPEVFSPSGSGSFLVTIGGSMTRDEAVAFRRKAQGEGMPRDIYIQNYESRDQRHARRSR